VASKRASFEWAKHAVDPAWQDLIQQVLDGRALGWDPHHFPSPASVEATTAFADYAKRRAASTTSGSKPLIR